MDETTFSPSQAPAAPAEGPPRGSLRSANTPPRSGAVRVFLLAAAGLLGLLVLFLIARFCFLPGARSRNVILIVVDTLRADRLGCYGFDRPTSPHVDSLAARGARFTNYSTVVPSTLASFTSLFTSNYPKDHGASRNGFSPFGDLPTLAEAFRDGGYETAAFVSSYCITSRFRVNQGFDHFDEKLTRSAALPDNRLYRSATEVTDSFLGWLDGRKSGKPFFTVVHYFDPHWPYFPPGEFIKEVTGASGAVRKATMQEIFRAKKVLKERKGEPTDRIRSLHDLYLAEIRYMDAEVGRIVSRFRGGGPDDGKTIIVFTADHGETFWEHEDYFNHGIGVYETTLHIPLIFDCPGLIPAGAVRNDPLSNIDLAPTLCRLAGVSVPSAFRGESFASLVLSTGGEGEKGGEGDSNPAADEGTLKGRLRFAEATMPYSVEKGAPRPNFRKAKAVRRGPWKYITVPYLWPKGKLFNVEEDPGERNDLSAREDLATVREALRKELRRWARDFDRNRDRDRFIDLQMKEKLKELGYIQ